MSSLKVGKKMKTNINITGVGVISSLGFNLEEHKRNLFSKKHTINRKRFTNGEHELQAFVGQVSNIPDIPEKYQKQSKNFKMAFSAFDEAIQSANFNKDIKHTRIAICLGTSLGGKIPGQVAFYQFKKGNYTIPEHIFEERQLHNLADQLIKHYGFNDASYYVISTACSASNNAVILGTQLLQDNKCDIAICGGCDELSDISLAGFSSLGAINKESACQPYSTGKGISLGEGAGFVVLERDRPRGFGKVLAGSITSDGYHITAPKSTGEGAIRVAENISFQSVVPLSKIDYINGHGTGTKANDNMEKSMFDKIFPESTKISSTKGSTGHALGAAGILEIINCILAIQENKIPATKIDFKENSNRFVMRDSIEKEIDYALNLSFAFGGNNSGILLARDTVSEETYKVQESVQPNVLSFASTIENSSDKKGMYEIITADFSKIEGLRYIDKTKSPRLNPAQFRKMDRFSKMIVNTVAVAIDRSGLNIKKIDSSKIGILFSTTTGPIEVVEDIENQIQRDGYNKVSAAKFPFTVMNAAAGMLSILFGIKGPVSVISSNVGFIDGEIYSRELMKNEGLEYIVLVSATQWTDLSLLAWETLGYDGDTFVAADYCQAMILSTHDEANTPKIICSEQIKYDNKSNSPKYIGNKIISAIKDKITDVGLELEDIREVVWNGNKKTSAVEYEIFESLGSLLKINICKYDLGFSSDGAGEELPFLLDDISFSPGYYIILSYSHFGGVSFMIIQK